MKALHVLLLLAEEVTIEFHCFSGQKVVVLEGRDEAASVGDGGARALASRLLLAVRLAARAPFAPVSIARSVGLARGLLLQLC